MPPLSPSVAVTDDMIGAPFESVQPQVVWDFVPPTIEPWKFKDNLPPWEAGAGVPGQHYQHARHGFVVFGVKQGKSVGFKRACGECGKCTRGLKEQFCGNRKCGGKKQVWVSPPCANEGCNRVSGRTGADGTPVCQTCWVEEDTAENGCPRCKKQPKSKTRADELCGNCVRDTNVQATRDAQQPALATFRAQDTRLQLLAKGEKGVTGTFYAGFNKQDDQKPFAFCVSPGGKQYSCCTAPKGRKLCLHQAFSNKTFGTTRCITHGGGTRCSYEYCVPDSKTGWKPHAKFVFEGAPVCLGCLMSLDPKNKKLKTCVSKEQFVAIANELALPELQAEAVERPECDATVGTGASLRRADMGWTLADAALQQNFKLINECNEGGPMGHQSGAGCYDADGIAGKFSGHMHDLGAPANSKIAGGWLDPQKLTDEEAFGTSETHATKKMRRLTDATLEQAPHMMPIRIVALHVDEYIDCHEVMHGSAFQHYRIGGGKETSGEKRLRTRPDFEHRHACNVRELRRLIALGASGQCLYYLELFKNGCDPETGLQPDEVCKREAAEAEAEAEAETEAKTEAVGQVSLDLTG